MKHYAARSYKQISTPALPDAGFNKIYPKSDDKFYTLDSAGNEIEVGTGSGGRSGSSLLGRTQLGSPSSSITVSGLPISVGKFKVKLRVTGLSGSSNILGLRFNGDAGSNYDWVSMMINSSGGNDSGATSIQLSNSVYQVGSTDFYYNISISNDHLLNKMIVGMGDGKSISGINFSGIWNNSTDYITSITLINGANMGTGSYIEVYDDTSASGGSGVRHGDGSDGALVITSGNTTTLDLSGSNTLIKNYSSIDIQSGGTLAITGQPVTGGALFLLSLGNVNIAGKIDLKGKGGAGGAAPAVNSSSGPVAGQLGFGLKDGNAHNPTSKTGGSGVLATYEFITTELDYILNKKFESWAGSGGASGGSINYPSTHPNIQAGSGGNGGGGLFISCGGTYTCTGTIDTSGENGGNCTGDNFWDNVNGAGGGGAAGSIVILYNILGTNSGTYTTNGGNGGQVSNGSTLGDAGFNVDNSDGGGGAGSIYAGGNGGTKNSPANIGNPAAGIGAGGGGASGRTLANDTKLGGLGGSGSLYYLILA